MQEDLTFRFLVLALFIGVRYIRWHARQQIGWQQSWPAMKRHPLDTLILCLLGLLWGTAVVVYMAIPQLVAPFSVPLPATLRWLAVLAAIAALGLLRWSDRCLGQNLSVTLRIREGHTLVIRGPYSKVRHPIYTATLIYAAAMGVITANYLLAAMFFVPMALLIGCRMGREEQMMIDQFGDEYRRYMQRTGRLLPRLQHGSQQKGSRDE